MGLERRGDAAKVEGLLVCRHNVVAEAVVARIVVHAGRESNYAAGWSYACSAALGVRKYEI